MQFKKISTLFLLLAIAVPTSSIFAESYATPENRRSILEEREARIASSTERREDRLEEREVRQASSTERRTEMQKELAKKKAEQTARRLTATVNRLDKIIIRLESRIDKAEDRGTETTEAKRYVAEARENLEKASLGTATFEDLILTDDKAKENFEKVRILASEIKGYLRETHKNLMNAVRSLKVVSDSESAEETNS